MKKYPPRKFAKLIKRSVSTLQRWDNEKRLVAKRTETNRRYYTDEDLVKVLGQDATDALIEYYKPKTS